MPARVRDYRSSGEAPRQGLRVTFDDIDVGGKGPRAVAVQPAGARRARDKGAQEASPPRRPSARRPARASNSGAQWVVPLMVAYGLGLAWLLWQRHVPPWVLPASLLLNMATFVAYWRDKHAAQTGRWRIQEDTLHLWSLAGGWPGASFAQQVLRHKSVKASFRAAYWTTVVVHCAALLGIGWFSRAF